MSTVPGLDDHLDNYGEPGIEPEDAYTPTTDRLRLAYRSWSFLTSTLDADEQFDAWLGAELANAYERGKHDVLRTAAELRDLIDYGNPYTADRNSPVPYKH